MANRVVLGDRGGGQIGLYISKPGFNALTTGDANLLFSSDAETVQAVQAGTVSIPNNGSRVVSYPNLGYAPTIILMPNFTGFRSSGVNLETDEEPTIYAWATQASNASTRLHVSIGTFGNTYAGNCSYIVLRMRYNG